MALLLGCITFTLKPTVCIENFHSDIQLYENGMLTVQETITVSYDSKKDNHGIIRELPTYYRQGLFARRVTYNIIDILQDSKPIAYDTEHDLFYDHIKIGSENIVLPHKVYTYTIIYTTYRQLISGKESDQLYWNVTGNGWQLPIKQASATIHMPSKFNPLLLTMHGYAGASGSKEDNVSCKIHRNTVICKTKEPLQVHEGLTIKITFPKEYISQPSMLAKIYWFYSDNVISITLLLLLLLFIINSFIIFFANKTTTIIPLFYPPDLPPSTVAYLYYKKFNARYFAADLVAMAVEGLMTITCNPNKKYVLHHQEKESASSTYYDQLLKKLFGKEKTITLNAYNDFQKALDFCQHTSLKATRPLLKIYHSWYFYFIIAGMATISLFITRSWELLLLFGLLLLVIMAIVRKSHQIYTPKGKKIKDAIAGFKLYLQTAEQHFINTVGTPPVKTPELFEKYLPYAIALKVERAWTAKFASVFEQLKYQNKAYESIWYSSLYADIFATTFTKDFTTSITTLTPTFTNTDNDGSSGGGSGGGGGSTW